ncbi:sensor histidine kinase [Eubacterium ruminantium]|uniref:sensor histidine kinase n=1 Tax=Eubacterium ruminantium TaxID=42322 RepID=UPI001567E3F6|nr:GHKL domain-containing protein [Eubacterium ruminantium]
MIGKKREKLKTEELERRYDELYSEYSELQFAFNEIKVNADNIEKQDEEIRKLHERMRSLKHDMKNHLMVILSYLNDGDDASARKYVSQIIDKLNSIHSYIETGNSLLNHILNEKLNEARSKNIRVKAEVENLAFERMQSMDFSALLTNMLDNAIRACLMEKDEKELIIKISKNKGYETIVIKNAITCSVLQDNPELKTTKQEKEEHGKGVPQIKHIVEKYEGICDFYEENGYFISCAFIPI